MGGLPYSMTSSQLAEIFGEAGQVRSVEIVYDKVITDRSRGFGFVTMGSIDEAKEAIRMFDGRQVGVRALKVNFPEVPRGGERKFIWRKIRSTNRSFVDTPHKIFAGNLHRSVTSEDLSNAFAKQPGFLSAKVNCERETGRSRCFGFISFSSAEAVESAVQAMNGKELEGRPLRLSVAAVTNHSNNNAYREQSESSSHSQLLDDELHGIEGRVDMRAIFSVGIPWQTVAS